MKQFELSKSGQKNYMMIEFASLSENLGLARLASASFASQLPFTLDDIEEIKVAISEAVSNSIIHAYSGQAGQLIRIQAGIYDYGVEFLVTDWGTGIPDIEQARQPSYSNDPERMGLGFVFMESFMDRLEVLSAVGQGTTVRLMKKKPVGEEQFNDSRITGAQS